MPSKKKQTPRQSRKGRARKDKLANSLVFAIISLSLVAIATFLILLFSLILPAASSPMAPALAATAAGERPEMDTPEKAAAGRPAQQPSQSMQTPPPARTATRPGAGTETTRRPRESSGASVTTVARPSRPEPRPDRRGTLVIVIDDVGYNLKELGPFLDLPFPLTFAVLPGLPYSAEAARRIKAAGKELILHQPMEALGGENPGPRAIYLSTPVDEAARILEENLDSLPGVQGVNNHMGSAVTRDPALMTRIMEIAKERRIYYLDSLTTPDTATGTVALRENMSYWERDVFLDNNPDRASIVHYIEEGKQKAERGGPAIMIGHVWSAELAKTLQELYPQLVAEGFSLSTISRLMLEEADARPRD